MKMMMMRSSRLILVLLFAVLATACLARDNGTGPDRPEAEEGDSGSDLVSIALR